MKKHYKFGNHKCWSTCQRMGASWEVGFYFGKEKVFFGNFIHEREAMEWFRMMNKQVRMFTRKYTFREGTPFSFYKKFMKNHLYNSYYHHVDQRVSTYQRTFAKSLRMDWRKFKTYSKRNAGHNKWHLRAA